MAKAKEKAAVEVTDEKGSAELAPKVEAPKATGKARQAGITAGRIVHFHREVNTQSGSKLVCLPAMILSEADAASNFKAEDSAVDLKVFTKHGDDVKNGMMFSDVPKANYWSWPAKV